MATVHAAQGDYTAADRFFDLLSRQREWVALDETLVAGYLYLLGRTRWLQACTESCPERSRRGSRSSRIEEARQVYAQMEAAVSPRELPFAPVLRLMMRGLLEMADHRYTQAERSLRQAAKMEQTVPITALFGSARLLLARLYVEMARPRDALAELAPLLAQCERAETLGLILKEGAAVVPALCLAVEQGVHAPFAARLLALLGAPLLKPPSRGRPQPVRVPDTDETLTPREVEVLRLIVAGASNRAIAEQLVITERTVKAHVSHILRKLNVSSRTQAAARVRDLLL